MRVGGLLTALLRLAVYGGCLVALAATLAAQGYKVEWVCDPKKKEQRFYRRDIGVVCWEGQTYRKTDPGGIPQYMLDYFDRVRENVRRAAGDARKTRAASPTSSPSRTGAAVPLSTPSPGPAVRPPPPAPPPKPLDPARLVSVAPGMARSMLREKLGQPESAMTITGSDGALEIWTYALTDGRTAEFRMKAGVLASYHIEGQKPTR